MTKTNQERALWVAVVLVAMVAIVGILLAPRGQSGSTSEGPPPEANHPTLAELEALLEPRIPGAETIASRVESIFPELKAIPGPISRGVLGAADGPSIDFFKGIPRESIDTTRRYLAPRLPILHGLDAVVDLPPGRYSLSYSSPATQRIEKGEGTLGMLRTLTGLLRTYAANSIVDGEFERAIWAAKLCLVIAEPLRNEPSVSALLSRVGAAAGGVHILENALRVGTLPDSSLVEMDAQLRRAIESAPETLAMAMRGALAEAVELRAAMPTAARLMIRDRLQGEVTQAVNELIAAAGDYPTLHEANRRMAKLGAGAASSSWTGYSALPIPSAVSVHITAVGVFSAARTAIAIERHTRDTGHPPDDWDDLIPTYIEARPVDPFGGGGPYWKTCDDGLIVFVGEVDSGPGEPCSAWNPEKKRTKKGATFRWVEPGKRRLVIVDAPVDD